MHRSHVVSAFVAMTIVLGAVTAWAAPMVPYDRAAFAAAQQAGQPVVVYVHASW